MVEGCLCPVRDLSRFPTLLQMSAPESGSTSTCLVPKDDVILTMIMGAGSVVSPVTL